MFSNILNDTLINAHTYLSKKQRKKGLFIILITLTNSIIEVVGLAFILPVIYLINSPEKVTKNEYLNFIYEHLPFLNNENEFIVFLVILLPFVFIGKNLISLIISYSQNKFINNIAVDLIAKQYNKTFDKSYMYFKNTNSNFILRDIASIPTDFANGILLPLINMITELFVTIFIITGIALFNFKVFCLLILILTPITVLFYISVKNKIGKMGNEVNEIRSSTYKTMFEAIFGIEEVKLYNKEKYFISRSLAPLKYLHNIYIRLNVFKAVPNKLIETVAVLSIVVIFFTFYLTSDSLEHLISILILFATASYRLMPSFNRIMSSIIDIKNKSYVFDILENFDTPANINRKTNEKELKIKSSIKIEKVNFGYSTEMMIFKELSLTIKKGENIGIIGESGSGKSTILKLILGFVPILYGKILVDDIILSEKNIHLFRQKIGLVQQDFYLLDSTLAENIAFGEDKQNINVKKLQSVIKLAQLDNFINQLPEKEFTKIGEFGGNLSGGQRQRIAIARALYKNAEILLFDEATSALDNKTEKEIIETINNLKDKEYTIIMIAHRKSSLKFCDNIYEIKNGQIFKN